MNTEMIIKALECCSKDDCDNCPNGFGNCYANLAGYALALIKELQAHNVNLKKENKYLRESLADEREHKEDMEGK